MEINSSKSKRNKFKVENIPDENNKKNVISKSTQASNSEKRFLC